MGTCSEQGNKPFGLLFTKVYETLFTGTEMFMASEEHHASLFLSKLAKKVHGGPVIYNESLIIKTSSRDSMDQNDCVANIEPDDDMAKSIADAFASLQNPMRQKSEFPYAIVHSEPAVSDPICTGFSYRPERSQGPLARDEF